MHPSFRAGPGDHRGRIGADRRRGVETRAASQAHRHHHGWQRAVGAAAGLPRIVGHRRGIQSVRAVVEEGCRLGLEQLTLYCLSVENWKRPPRELKFLMRLLRHFLVVERSELMEQNVQLRMIGRREGLPQDVLARVRPDREQTADNTG